VNVVESAKVLKKQCPASEIVSHAYHRYYIPALHLRAADKKFGRTKS